jgi:hypothetical protein
MDLIPLDKEIQRKVYDDLFWPSLKEAWKALWNIAGLVTTISLPIQLLNHYANGILRNNINKLNEKLKNIPEENIIEATPDIWVPILEKLTYTKNEKISDLFLELLKKASNKNELSLVHPKFIKIIESLSEDEALILEYIFKKHIFQIPFITVNLHKKWESSYNTILNFFTWLGENINLNYNNNLNSYLQNLESLWIIKSMNDIYLVDVWEYKPYDFLINHQIIKNIEKWLNPEIQEIKNKKGLFEITQLWIDFLNAIYLNNKSL